MEWLLFFSQPSIPGQVCNMAVKVDGDMPENAGCHHHEGFACATKLPANHKKRRELEKKVKERNIQGW